VAEPLLPVAEARARVLAPLAPLAAEWVTLPEARGRALAGDLRAKRDQPPVAVSAMDGYAVRAADTRELGRPFRVIGEAPAGSDLAATIGPFEAARIFTGGAVPQGADAVVIQENAAREGAEVRFGAAVTPGTFVRPAGLDFARGWTGLRAGTLLDARAVGLAASMGHVWVPVRRRPRIGLLATGNELRLPGETPEGSQIVGSNSLLLAAMLAGWGAVPVDLGICRDEGEALVERLRAAAGLDFLVTTGGASVGDHDLVRAALAREGVRLDFWRIAMRPGKPLLFGSLGPLPVLGFPGNPVSTAVCALIFLRAALQRLLGLPEGLRARQVPLDHAWPLANDQREDYLRAFWVEEDGGGRGRVRTAARQDSSMQATLAAANALVVRPPFDPPREPGHPARVIDLREALDGLR
jgi:molybdopterin molybdotransferase